MTPGMNAGIGGLGANDYYSQLTQPAANTAQTYSSFLPGMYQNWQQQQNNPYKGTMVQTNAGMMPYDAIVNQVMSRYGYGKTPALAVKSGLTMGIPEDILRSLPGVDEAAFNQGKNYMTSGAFTYDENDANDPQKFQQMLQARSQTGLDAFGFPQEQVAMLQAQGRYGQGKEFDPQAYTQGGHGSFASAISNNQYTGNPFYSMQQQASTQLGNQNTLMNNQNQVLGFAGFGNQNQQQPPQQQNQPATTGYNSWWNGAQNQNQNQQQSSGWGNVTQNWSGNNNNNNNNQQSNWGGNNNPQSQQNQKPQQTANTFGGFKNITNIGNGP